MADKLRFSVYKITINTNVAYESMTDKQKSDFKKMGKYLFSNHIQKYITFRKDGPIKAIKNDYRFEASSKNLVHLHGIIHITHKADIRLDYHAIKLLLTKAFGSNLYMDIRVSTDETKAWEQYINKTKGTMRVIQL